MTFAFLSWQLCVSVAKLEHCVALKEEKQPGQTESSSLLGVSESFGLEGLNVWVAQGQLATE